ncbi:MAG: AAA family ATPase [Syntrophobacterales bacterium]|nr:MAG: AAA family ATPase [Syntrophobacterales bacterium]
MHYYEILGLEKEPFSSSPDPAFFYLSDDYRECLQRLEIAIRLKRGLNIILGQVGTGKTSLSRVLYRMFQRESRDYVFHFILDPRFPTEFQFFNNLVKLFDTTPSGRSTFEYKEAIQNYLFQKGIEEKKTIVLLIDEGQKLPIPHLEILRNLLNYETNEYKLLQLLIFAQMEFTDRVKGVENFLDRVNMKYVFYPLNEVDTRKMIEFRLRTAGLNSGRFIFTDDAYMAIYEETLGYPRKIINLCHHALITMLIKEKEIIDGEIIRITVKARGELI